jgi:hypothetical protein
MHARTLLIGTLALGATALAAGTPFLEGKLADVIDTPGLVVYQISLPDRCEDGDAFADDETAVWMSKNDVRAKLLDRNRNYKEVPELVGTGRNVTTMQIAYVDGKEFDRRCGCVETKDAIRWMIGLKAGRTASDLEREAVGDATEGDFDVQTELDIVQKQYCGGHHVEAFETLHNLWVRIPIDKPEFMGHRLARVAHDMGVLARASEDVQGRLRKMRDALSLAKDDTYEATTRPTPTGSPSTGCSSRTTPRSPGTRPPRRTRPASTSPRTRPRTSS